MSCKCVLEYDLKRKGDVRSFSVPPFLKAESCKSVRNPEKMPIEILTKLIEKKLNLALFIKILKPCFVIGVAKTKSLFSRKHHLIVVVVRSYYVMTALYLPSNFLMTAFFMIFLAEKSLYYFSFLCVLSILKMLKFGNEQ